MSLPDAGCIEFYRGQAELLLAERCCYIVIFKNVLIRKFGEGCNVAVKFIYQVLFVSQHREEVTLFSLVE